MKDSCRWPSAHLLQQEQTFIYREEALAQDAAAATEFHPQPAVGGDKGLGYLIAAKPPWKGKGQSGHCGHGAYLTTT